MLRTSQMMFCQGLLSRFAAHITKIAAGTNSSGTSRAQGEAAEETKWKALVIVVPVRLGVEVVNKNYMNGLIKCLKLPQSLGFVGGRPRSSLYFVGFQGSRLLYLDPHTVQKVPPFQTDLRRVSSSFHCAKLRTMKLDELDPSLALGFYCRDRAEFFHFWSSIEVCVWGGGVDICLNNFLNREGERGVGVCMGE
eukprot:jgi/Bigna1/54463/estExt_Genewise1Plus.C_350009